MLGRTVPAGAGCSSLASLSSQPPGYLVPTSVARGRRIPRPPLGQSPQGCFVDLGWTSPANCQPYGLRCCSVGASGRHSLPESIHAFVPLDFGTGAGVKGSECRLVLSRRATSNPTNGREYHSVFAHEERWKDTRERWLSVRVHLAVGGGAAFGVDTALPGYGALPGSSTRTHPRLDGGLRLCHGG